MGRTRSQRSLQQWRVRKCLRLPLHWRGTCTGTPHLWMLLLLARSSNAHSEIRHLPSSWMTQWMPIIINALGITQDDKNNWDHSDQELNLATSLSLPTRLCPHDGPAQIYAHCWCRWFLDPRELRCHCCTTVSGLAPKLPTEIPSVSDFAFL